MQSSQETYRTKWLVLVSVWMLIAGALILQTRLVDTYLGIAGGLGLRGAAAPTTPLQASFPAFAADGQTWVRHALMLLEREGDQFQLRRTTIDNAPYGREVHWNSTWAWMIAGAGWVQQLFTGQPLPSSVERATLWLMPLVFFLLIVCISAWLTKNAGLFSGVFTAFAIIAQNRIYEGFFPTYVDHHGLLTVSVLGTILGAAYMGGGWWQPKVDSGLSLLPSSEQLARRGAAFSALCGAAGLWVSAASVIPPIAIVGLAGVTAMVVHGRTAIAQGAVFTASAWRLWGRVGAAASLGFYLLEYFPFHMALRLEANHPFHALAWLGGGELIAQFGERWLAQPDDRFRRLWTLGWPLVAVSLTPVAILVAGPQVLAFLDPFMANLHKLYIQEFLPVWKTIRLIDGEAKFNLLVVDSLPLFAAIATLSYRRREASIVLWFATVATGLLTAMAWIQTRWLLNAAGAQTVLGLVVVVVWSITLRPAFRWLLLIFVVGVLHVPSIVIRYTGAKSDTSARRVSPRDASLMLHRDIAAVLRGSQPTGEITMLSSPNGSTSIGYYGRFKTLGTLYWENTAGLKSAAAIWGAKSEEEAAALIRKHGITHIALVSEENFINQYRQLLDPAATPEQIRTCFGNRLMLDKVVPQWLQMIPYNLPPDLTTLKVGVMLFKVNFEQSLADAIYHIALAQIATGELEAADRSLAVLTNDAPQLYQPWLRRGELNLARKNFEQAEAMIQRGASLAPENERSAILAMAGENFYRQVQPAYSLRFYRASLEARRTPEVLAYTAWILASTRDDDLRNGAEALRMASEALKADPNSPTFLNSQAAALAELGRIPEALTIAERALANAKLRGEYALVSVSQNRMALLRAGQPIRE